ncbi:MAG: hypothetical protein KAT04_01155 [Methylococcales bacterium]|nr:hypothetical protein [Methylococcales bacterium]
MNKTKLLILVALNLFCINVYAATNTNAYKIELIIFSQDMPNTEVFEQTESKIVWPKRVDKLSDYGNITAEFKTLKRSYANLASGKGYKPLKYAAWIQKIKVNSLSRAVKITNRDGTINGYFRIQRGHLIHMIADIEYSTDSLVYRLNEKRRFKLNDTHYLDHPKFGILARISPVEKSK